MAWARAWDEISVDLVTELSSLLVAGGRVSAADLRRARRLQLALDVAASRVEALVAETGVQISRDLRGLVDAAGAAQASIIDSQLPRGAVDLVDLASWSRVDPRQIDAIVARTTQQITSRLRPLSDEADRVMRRELVRGVTAGSNPRVTARRIVDRAGEGFSGGLTRALTVARTETVDAYRSAAALGQAQHTDVLAGWMWLASLSSRTCPACLGMHGEVFPLDEPGPLGHQNCRCGRMPVTKPWSELGFPDLDEPESLVPDADLFFAGLTPVEQQGILGHRGYQAWLAGKWPREKWGVRRSNDGWRDSVVVAKPPRLQPGGPGAVRVPPPKGGVPQLADGPKPGRVTREKGTRLESHEVLTGYRIASLGIDVHFLAPADGRTPDAWILGERWEIKAPKGAGRSTIEQAIRRGSRQADRVLLDLHRTALAVDAVIAQIERYWRVRVDGNAVASVWVLPENVAEHFTKERP